MSNLDETRIVVVGLGYVGLPLAVALAKHFPVIGFDIDQKRIEELQNHHDRTGEIEDNALKGTTLELSNDTDTIEGHDIYIVTVPTPITSGNQPDLTPLRSASETVGKIIKEGAIVVYESTVYPGVTEDVCAPILEKHSGLKSGEGFFLGYSPERINPGDKEHTVETITKVVSGQNEKVANILKDMYGTINNDNIFVAANIKTAEAAKVIENAQRDINIAFVNEIATIFARMGISVYDVLDAAATKWNFLKFHPGLVGGHCIGVDPYYLAHAARQHSYEPAVILSGRRINENMSMLIAAHIQQEIKEKLAIDKAKILMLGLTFKENIPDLRNTKAHGLKTALEEHGHQVDVHDTHADSQEAKEWYDIDLKTCFEGLSGYDVIVGAVPHSAYMELDANAFKNILTPNGLIADVKNMWRGKELPEGIHYWSL